jgi:hypothetical protein
MKRALNTFVARGTLTFTVAVVFVSIYNLLFGQNSMEYFFLLEILGFVACLEVLDFFFSWIPFPNRFLYVGAEFIVMYLCYLVFAFFGHWFGFSLAKIMMGSGIFLVLFVAIHLYYHLILQRDSKEINSHLKKRKKN